jgi:hypothetical protein
MFVCRNSCKLPAKEFRLRVLKEKTSGKNCAGDNSIKKELKK